MAKTISTAAKTSTKTDASATKQKAAPKAKPPTTPAAPAPEPAPEPVVATADAVKAKTESAPAEEGPTLAAMSDEFLSKLNEFIIIGHALKKSWVALEKRQTRELKAAHKLNMKKKGKGGTRSPSGFTMPVRISDDLSSYLGLAAGTEISRTDVSRRLNVIFREQNMPDKDNGRIIHPTPELAKLLRLGPDDQLTYFNLQKFVSHHFAKKGDAPKAVA